MKEIGDQKVVYQLKINPKMILLGEALAPVAALVLFVVCLFISKTDWLIFYCLGMTILFSILWILHAYYLYNKFGLYITDQKIYLYDLLRKTVVNRDDLEEVFTRDNHDCLNADRLVFQTKDNKEYPWIWFNSDCVDDLDLEANKLEDIIADGETKFT
jgi:hypothetical protein